MKKQTQKKKMTDKKEEKKNNSVRHMLKRQKVMYIKQKKN